MLAGQRDRRALLAVVPGRARLAHQQARLVLVCPRGALIAYAHARVGCHRANGAWCLLDARKRREVAWLGCLAPSPPVRLPYKVVVRSGGTRPHR